MIELNAIRERHEVGERNKDLWTGSNWTETGRWAHEDRGALLAMVEARAAEVAGLRAALAALVDAAIDTVCVFDDTEDGERPDHIGTLDAACVAAQVALAKETT